MARFTKDVLYAGTLSVPDGKGGRRMETFSPERVKHLGNRLKEMTAAGVLPPVSLNHQPDAKPETEAERLANKARYNIGHTLEGELTPEGYVTAELDVPVDEHAKQIPAIRFASPMIDTDFVDGNGRLWPGESILHIAATPWPVQHQQQPFKPTALCLSLTDYVSPPVQLGDPAVADEPKKPEEKPKKKDGEGEGGGGIDMGKLVAALAQPGIDLILGDDTTIENLAERLIVAVNTKLAVESPEPINPEGTVQTPKESDPLMMSLEQKSKKLDGAIGAQEKRIVGMERNDMTGRAKAALTSGRIGPPVHKQLVEEIGKVALSLDGEGKVVATPTHAKLDAYEALQPDTAWAASTQLGLPQPRPHPEASAADDDEKTIEEIAKHNWGTRRR